MKNKQTIIKIIIPLVLILVGLLFYFLRHREIKSIKSENTIRKIRISKEQDTNKPHNRAIYEIFENDNNNSSKNKKITLKLNPNNQANIKIEQTDNIFDIVKEEEEQKNKNLTLNNNQLQTLIIDDSHARAIKVYKKISISYYAQTMANLDPINLKQKWLTFIEQNQQLKSYKTRNHKETTINQQTIYYMRLGPFRNLSQAERVCKALKSYKQECIVVKD